MIGLITGATSGIGFALACELAPMCRTLFITARIASRADALIAKLKQIQPDISVNIINIKDFSTDSAHSVVKKILEQTQHLDFIIANGGYYEEGSLMESSPSMLSDNINHHLLFHHHIIRGLLPAIDLGSRKRIVITGSTAAYGHYVDVPVYGVVKWALRGYAVNLREELKGRRIGVSFISPGPTWTAMWDGEKLNRNRLLEPSDIAKIIAVSFTLSEQAVVDELLMRPIDGDLHG